MSIAMWLILLFAEILLLILAFIRMLLPGRLWTRKSATILFAVMVVLTSVTMWRYIDQTVEERASWLSTECKYLGEGTFNRKAYKCSDGFIYLI